MDKKKLSQIRYLQKEIELLKKQIANIDYEITTDSVRGSDPHFPYTERTFTITGINFQEYNRRVKKLRGKLKRRIEELLALVEEINDYIEGIDDSLIRQIIILRYIYGYTWEQVAANLGGNNTADSVRMMHNRFLKGA